MKKIFTLLFAFLVSVSLMAQSWESIKNNQAYISAEGFGNSIDEADKDALAGLMSQISLHISNETKNSDSVTNRNGEIEDVSQFTSTLKTYGEATLTNTVRVILSNEPDAHVGRWIKRSEVQKIFASRIAKVKDLVSQALAAEGKGKADDALRFYYWSLTLLKSVQHPNTVAYTDEKGKEHMLMTWIPVRMSEVFDDLEAKVVKRNGDDLDLFITYKGKPVNSVDYTFFDGKGWSNIYSAKDGRGVLELSPGTQSESIRLKYEFEYRGQAQIDPELESVLNVVKSTPMRDAYADVSTKVAGAEPTAMTAATSFSTTAAAVKAAPKSVAEAEPYMKIINKVTTAIRNKDYVSVEPLFSAEGWDIYKRLVGYGKARLVGNPQLTFYNYADNVVARGVQMAFSFARGVRKSFVEDVVFTFDRNMKIVNVTFGLGNTAADDILHKGVWPEQARVALMSFLENYKTAYGLERLDYINSLFDDNAVIIVGNVLKTLTVADGGDGGMASLKNNTIIKKNRYTKNQYINNLKRCFAANEYINVRFANNDVVKMSAGGELYAIQIAQDYYSTNYGDKGYLFLMVDINAPDKPIIKVRTWQPEKDPNFGLYGPGDF